VLGEAYDGPGFGSDGQPARDFDPIALRVAEARPMTLALTGPMLLLLLLLLLELCSDLVYGRDRKVARLTGF
jgi:hypothetical protein